MSAWQIHGYGENEKLTLSTSSRIPAIKHPKDILVEVHAASVNPIDIRMRGGYGHSLFNIWRNQGGMFSTRSEFPLVLGRDFSGVVIETGKDVKTYKAGDEVWGVVNAQKQGSHAEYTVVSSSEVALKPKNLTHVEAASIPYVGLTNWAALYSVGELTPSNTRGQRILVIAGSGGIGTFAIQLIKAWGGDVTTTCSSESVEIVRDLGADVVIDYKTQDVQYELRQQDRFDLILDPLVSKKRVEYINYLKQWRNSKLVTIAPPFLRNIDTYGVVPGVVKSVGDLSCDVIKGAKDGCSVRWAFFTPSQKGLREISKLVEMEKIRPVVEKVYDFEDLLSAYEKLEAGHSRGKTVIQIK
ncbi:hypothetical protein LOTGIDRAFT_162911 [Lottia gigantea]|uniref:NAD(P)H oxidoreductase RTN4IP1, mitochondrial n=1 Tax=Lottia gigantea TaxID=225164 RepID=V4AFT5_LOTGI|nr:hypothetical protein LOTGIDRAFT_162911 [Lottia gigantea]ESO92256.1 hypothetical protein LOTGIDRAFT_162911 [Lottia gigantea]